MEAFCVELVSSPHVSSHCLKAMRKDDKTSDSFKEFAAVLLSKTKKKGDRKRQGGSAPPPNPSQSICTIMSGHHDPSSCFHTPIMPVQPWCWASPGVACGLSFHHTNHHNRKSEKQFIIRIYQEAHIRRT